MTMHDEIETRLRRAVDVTPSEDGLRWLDERVTQIIARPSIHPLGVPAPRRFLRPLALAAALVLLAGAVGAAVGLLDRMVNESSPGWRTAWDRAEILGIRQTDAGLTLTLERAYTDLNQVMVGITVEGLEALPIPSDGSRNDYLLSWVTELRGPNGWTIQPGSSNVGRVIETDLSAFIITFGSPPPVAGTWELTVTSVGYGGSCTSVGCPGMIDGTWRFEFELPEPTGTLLSTNASDTVGQATLTLTQLRVSPTVIAARIALDVVGSTVAYWSPGTGQEGEVVRHGGTSYEIGEETLLDASPDENEYRTSSGSDEAAGTWEIVIPDLWYTSSDGQNVHLDGPWTLTVTVP